MLGYITDICALYAEQLEREFQDFCSNQYDKRGIIPDRDEYFLARSWAYDIDNAPPYPKWKSRLAAFMIKLFRL